MLNINNFFNNFKSPKFQNNLKKTKNLFLSLKNELENYEIPMMESYEKNYKFDFSEKTVKRFLKYKNVIVIGMGGSILGTKSIYSFFEEKIKKKFFLL